MADIPAIMADIPAIMPDIFLPRWQIFVSLPRGQIWMPGGGQIYFPSLLTLLPVSGFECQLNSLGPDKRPTPQKNPSQNALQHIQIPEQGSIFFPHAQVRGQAGVFSWEPCGG